MGLPCRVRVNYRGYAVAVHRRLCYPHVTSVAVVYGGRGYWTNGQRICLTVRDATIAGLESIKEGKGYWVALYQRATREIQNSLPLCGVFTRFLRVLLDLGRPRAWETQRS
jgi:hypothetical protein